VRVAAGLLFCAAFQERFAEADGVRLHGLIGGPAEGEPVVLLHGWPRIW